jgi:hypothetical protein
LEVEESRLHHPFPHLDQVNSQGSSIIKLDKNKN